MLIRVRSKAGIWRIPDVKSNTTVHEIQEWIYENHGLENSRQLLSLDHKKSRKLLGSKTVGELGLTHGDLIHLDFEGDYASVMKASSCKRKVNADGSLSMVSHDVSADKSGFRPGLKSLRDMKMHWTIGEFMEMDSQFEYKMKRQEKVPCSKLVLDTSSCDNFQLYLRQFAFQQSRCGWLYGTKETNQETGDIVLTMECIYEPPQQGDPYGFEVFDDPHGEKVDAIAEALGLEKIGWCFSHPPRENETFHFSSREVLLAAQLQLDAGGKGTPFVTLKVTLDKEGQASFEAFQVSDQCMEMFSSGALLENLKNPMTCGVHDTFTAIVESKPTKEVDNNFFLGLVRVTRHTSFLRNKFPKLNREGEAGKRTRDTLASILTEDVGIQKLDYIVVLADFQLLVFLADFLDLKTDIPVICHSIRHQDQPLDTGFQLLINSVAGRR